MLNVSREATVDFGTGEGISAMRLNAFLFARPPLAVLSLLAALSIGCGAVRNPALESARDAYQKARQDPMIVRHAAVALDRAGQSLQEADRLWT